MKKALRLLIPVLLLTILLSACSDPVYLATTTGNYAVEEVVLAQEYDGSTPPSGSQYLLVTIEAKDADMDALQSTFFDVNGTPVFVYTNNIEENFLCESITYAAKNNATPPDIYATLLFTVPGTWSKDQNFTIMGDNITTAALKIEQ